jgi:hypothetical protein
VSTVYRRRHYSEEEEEEEERSFPMAIRKRRIKFN